MLVHRSRSISKVQEACRDLVFSIVIQYFAIPSPSPLLSSSASSNACQKNKYGDIVVPSIATNIVAKSELNSKCGIILAKKNLFPITSDNYCC